MKQRGFTLLELIVVVALAGIIVAGVLLNSSLIDPNKKFITRTEKIAKLIHFAHQQAEISNQNYAISSTTKGYVFLHYQGGDWTLMNDKPLISKELPEQLKQELSIDTKLVEPISPSQIKQKKYVPHILMLSSGEMSPFAWSFSDLDNDLEIILTGAYNGKINIEQKAL